MTPIVVWPLRCDQRRAAAAPGHRRRCLLLLLVAAAVLGGCQRIPGVDATVEVRGANRFDPGVLTVDVGTTVAWHNRGTRSHTVTSDEAIADNPAHAQRPEGAEAWDSEVVAVGGTWTRTFDTVGDHTYFCRIHEQHDMIGLVRVVDPEGGADDAP